MDAHSSAQPRFTMPWSRRPVAPDRIRSSMSLLSSPVTTETTPGPLKSPDARSISLSNLLRWRPRGPSGSSARPTSPVSMSGPGPARRWLKRLISSPKTPSAGHDETSSVPTSSETVPQSIVSPSLAAPDASAITPGVAGAGSNLTALPSDSPVQRAQEALERGGRLGSRAAENLERVPDTWEAASSTAEVWEAFVSKIGAFAGVVDAIGEVHPYLKAATSVINGIVKPIVAQVARDEKFEELLKEMDLAYNHVINDSGTVARLKKLPDNRQTALLKDICLESEQCALFIQNEYIKKFWARAAKNAFTGDDVDGTIDRYKSRFSSLRARWQDEILRDLKVDTMLDKLSPMRNAGPTSQRACLQGTRTDVLREICRWIDSSDSPRVLFLLGVAGSGKTSIANTVAEIGQERRQLASFFAFNRNDATRVPDRLFGTIAHQLARWDEQYRDWLVGILKSNVMLADSPDIMEQWKRLIVEPAINMSTSSTGPVLVVIDAFDECPELSDNSRQRLLECLTRHAAELPDRFRVLVTSRPLDTVSKALAASSVRRFDLSDFSAAEDIRRYVRSQLEQPDEGGLSDQDCHAIADAACGLFQWAATACRFLLNHAGTTLDAKFRANLDRLIHGDPRPGQPTGGRPRPPSLDWLYSAVLEDTFDVEDTTVIANFRSAVAVMLCAKTPLSITILHSIYVRARPSNESVVTGVLGSMGVVLEGASNPSSPVRPMHLSFREFILDASRSGPWHISGEDIAEGHCIIALGGLRIMASDLSFNMHQIPSSRRPRFSGSLLSLVRRSENTKPLDIPAGHDALAYTISNLHLHLKEMLLETCSTMHTDDIRVALRGLLYRKLLFWFEWSAVRNDLKATQETLQAAQQMLTGDDLLFAKDAALFFENQDWLIKSAPHIYLSSLPFAPAASLVRQRFIHHFPGIPTVSPLSDSWASFGSFGRVTQLSGVSWSTDGRYIREDDEHLPYRCWDTRTGTRVDVPHGVFWRYPSHQSEDGSVKVSATSHKHTGLTVLDVESNQPNIAAIAIKLNHRLSDLTGPTYDISPSGRWLMVTYPGVVGGWHAGLWDLEASQKVDYKFPRSNKARETVRFSSDSREVAIYSPDSPTIPVFAVDPQTNGPWLSSYINFRPQPTTDAAGNLFPDARLRCEEPDIVIPRVFEHLLWRPGMRLLLGAEPLTIDFANACYGTEWARCYAGGLEGEEIPAEQTSGRADVEAEQKENQ